MKRQLFFSLGVLSSCTIGLYFFSHIFSTLDRAYFRANEGILTHSETIVTNGSMVTNYTYSHTPFFYPMMFFSFAALFVPIFLVWFLSVRFFRVSVGKKTYVQSLFFPLVYALISIISFFIVMDPALGWEYSVGMALMFMEIGLVFTVTAIVNGIMWKKKKKKSF